MADKRKFGDLFNPYLQPRSSGIKPTPAPSPFSALSDLVSKDDIPRNALLDYNMLSALGLERNSLLGGLPTTKPTMGGLFSLAQLTPSPPALPVTTAAIKRKVFFSFHYADILRVNNVRQIGKIGADRETKRNFYDRSLWESKQLEGPEALKKLIREGMVNASAVCVLIGTHTWQRRWVKYEIARAVIDGRGLFGLHINGLNHTQTRQPDPLGYNPFHVMGVYKDASGKFLLYEKRPVTVNQLTGAKEYQWHPYLDYSVAVKLPPYLQEPSIGYVMPLSSGAHAYVFDSKNHDLGAWIDQAAKRAGYQ